MFEKRHYGELAMILAETVMSLDMGVTNTRKLIESFAKELRGTNANYDEKKFIKAVYKHLEDS